MSWIVPEKIDFSNKFFDDDFWFLGKLVCWFPVKVKAQTRPLLVISAVLTLLIGVINPFTTGRGLPCTHWFLDKSSKSSCCVLEWNQSLHHSWKIPSLKLTVRPWKLLGRWWLSSGSRPISQGRTVTSWWFQIFFFLMPILGKISILTSIFFKWVGSTTNQVSFREYNFPPWFRRFSKTHHPLEPPPKGAHENAQYRGCKWAAGVLMVHPYWILATGSHFCAIFMYPPRKLT